MTISLSYNSGHVEKLRKLLSFFSWRSSLTRRCALAEASPRVGGSIIFTIQIGLLYQSATAGKRDKITFD
jgi:hypothetical protein